MSRTFIIAEAGVNHNGDVALAHRLVDLAADSGADAVKFQTWKTELVTRRDTPLVAYQALNDDAATMFELEQRLELGEDDFRALKRHAEDRSIQFLSTAFDVPSLRFLVHQLGVAMLKVPSGEADNVPFLRQIARTRLPTILSTGMCDLAEVAFAVDTLNAVWDAAGRRPGLTILHCTTAYPTPAADVNLRCMATLADRFGVPIGLSDHSDGITAALAATALGAAMIEKHFTLDRGLPGPDHAASLDPDQLKALVEGVRQTETMLGSPDKVLLPIERDTVALVRRSLVAARDIATGEIIGEDAVVPLRPQDGIPARDIDRVVGRPAWRSFRLGEVLRWEA
jgi:N,N'-diacetyllegionaminate synthase